MFMRRILINDDIIKLAEEYAEHLFENRSKNFKTPCELLIQLSKDLKNNGQLSYERYVNKIILFFPHILTLKYGEFIDYTNKHFSNLTEDELHAKIPGCKGKSFYKAVINAMRYNDVQKTEIRPYMKRMGLNTCVYCNASYAVATDDRKATFQVDHWLPKSEYPFLCISFFNLYPACMHCNQIKSKKTTCNFCLYTDNSDLLDPFKFSIDDKSIIKYMLFNNADLLKVNLKSDTLTKEAEEHFNSFHLGGLYSQFSDEIEEIVWKAKIYNESYRNQLLAAYNKKFHFNMYAFKRFYLGFYPDVKDVHKRPLTLLKQSIAKEMGLE